MGIPLALRHSVCLSSLEDRAPAGAKSALAACSLRVPDPGIEVNNTLYVTRSGPRGKRGIWANEGCRLARIGTNRYHRSVFRCSSGLRERGYASSGKAKTTDEERDLAMTLVMTQVAPWGILQCSDYRNTDVGAWPPKVTDDWSCKHLSVHTPD